MKCRLYWPNIGLATVINGNMCQKDDSQRWNGLIVNSALIVAVKEVSSLFNPAKSPANHKLAADLSWIHMTITLIINVLIVCLCFFNPMSSIDYC